LRTSSAGSLIAVSAGHQNVGGSDCQRALVGLPQTHICDKSGDDYQTYIVAQLGRSTYIGVAQSIAKAIKINANGKRARLLTAGLSGAADLLGGTTLGSVGEKITLCSPPRFASQ